MRHHVSNIFSCYTGINKCILFIVLAQMVILCIPGGQQNHQKRQYLIDKFSEIAIVTLIQREIFILFVNSPYKYNITFQFKQR